MLYHAMNLPCGNAMRGNKMPWQALDVPTNIFSSAIRLLALEGGSRTLARSNHCALLMMEHPAVCVYCNVAPVLHQNVAGYAGPLCSQCWEVTFAEALDEDFGDVAVVEGLRVRRLLRIWEAFVAVLPQLGHRLADVRVPVSRFLWRW